MQRISNLPDWLGGIVVPAIAAIIGMGGVLLSRKWVARLHAVALHNEVVSYYLSTVAIFYGIMLGLIAVGVWEGFNDARTAVALEAGAVAALYRDVSGFPEPDRSALEADLREYTRYEIEEAWALHRQGIISPSACRSCGVSRTSCSPSNPKTWASKRYISRPFALSTISSKSAACGWTV